MSMCISVIRNVLGCVYTRLFMSVCKRQTDREKERESKRENGYTKKCDV